MRVEEAARADVLGNLVVKDEGYRTGDNVCKILLRLGSQSREPLWRCPLVVINEGEKGPSTFGYRAIANAAQAAYRLDHVRQIETFAISYRHAFARVLRIIVNHDDIERRRTLLLRQRCQQTAQTFRPSVSGYAHAHLRMLGTIWSDHRSTVDAC